MSRKQQVESMEATSSLLPVQRQQLILDIMKKNYTARCSQLSALLEVSEMTIRRDLGALERQGMVKRTHGGAVFRHERVTNKFKYQNSREENFEAKECIARKAAELIEPNDVVLLVRVQQHHCCYVMCSPICLSRFSAIITVFQLKLTPQQVVLN